MFPSQVESPLDRRTMLVALGGGLLLPALSRAEDSGWAERFEANGLSVWSSLRWRNHGLSVDDLVTTRETLVRHLGLKLAAGTVHVVIAADRAHYRDMVIPHDRDAGKRKAVFLSVKQTHWVFTYPQRDLLKLLRHELVHAWLHQGLTFVPMWLDEGLATLYQVPANEISQQTPYFGQVQRRVRFRIVPKLSDLETITTLRDMTAGRYRDCWSWAHFLLFESRQSLSLLRSYLAEIDRGVPPTPLSRTVRGLGDAAARYRTHFRNWA